MIHSAQSQLDFYFSAVEIVESGTVRVELSETPINL
jgi:hypothetical protein